MQAHSNTLAPVSDAKQNYNLVLDAKSVENMVLPNANEARGIIGVAFKIRDIPITGDRKMIAAKTDEPENYIELFKLATKIEAAKTLVDWQEILSTIYSCIYTESEKIYKARNDTSIIGSIWQFAKGMKQHYWDGSNYTHVYLKNLFALYNYCRNILRKNDFLVAAMQEHFKKILQLNEEILNIRSKPPKYDPCTTLMEIRDKQLKTLVNLGSDAAADLALQLGIIAPHQQYGKDVLENNKEFNKNIPLCFNVGFFEYYITEVVFKTTESKMEGEKDIDDFLKNCQTRRLLVEPKHKGVTDLTGGGVVVEENKESKNTPSATTDKNDKQNPSTDAKITKAATTPAPTVTNPATTSTANATETITPPAPTNTNSAAPPADKTPAATTISVTPPTVPAGTAPTITPASTNTSAPVVAATNNSTTSTGTNTDTSVVVTPASATAPTEGIALVTEESKAPVVVDKKSLATPAQGAWTKPLSSTAAIAGSGISPGKKPANKPISAPEAPKQAAEKKPLSTGNKKLANQMLKQIVHSQQDLAAESQRLKSEIDRLASLGLDNPPVVTGTGMQPRR